MTPSRTISYDLYWREDTPVPGEALRSATARPGCEPATYVILGVREIAPFGAKGPFRRFRLTIARAETITSRRVWRIRWFRKGEHRA